MALDKEILAISQIKRILVKLTPSGRYRVLSYLTSYVEALDETEASEVEAVATPEPSGQYLKAPMPAPSCLSHPSTH